MGEGAFEFRERTRRNRSAFALPPASGDALNFRYLVFGASCRAGFGAIGDLVMAIGVQIHPIAHLILAAKGDFLKMMPVEFLAD